MSARQLYFYVGAYVSANSRNGTWGTGAIAAISERLSLELPGLRGFSSTNIKNMRIFFEQWTVDANRQLATDDLTESDFAAFFSVGFTHHMEIIFKCRSMAERWYYIRKTAMEFWNVEDLKRRIRARDYMVNGKAVNNFVLTIPSNRQVSKAVQAFKGEEEWRWGMKMCEMSIDEMVLKIGAEVIPGLLESIRKATSERREFGKGKKATRGSSARAREAW